MLGGTGEGGFSSLSSDMLNARAFLINSGTLSPSAAVVAFCLTQGGVSSSSFGFGETGGGIDFLSCFSQGAACLSSGSSFIRFLFSKFSSSANLPLRSLALLSTSCMLIPPPPPPPTWNDCTLGFFLSVSSFCFLSSFFGAGRLP